jgi:gentisate 1,2-dioxygenase
MQVHEHRNTGAEPWVRLSFSNAPLLRSMGVLFSEEGASIGVEEAAAQRMRTSAEQAVDELYVRASAPDLPILARGARLRGYEFLTDIEIRNDFALHWPYTAVEPMLPAVPGDGKRTIWLMYNPVTERRAGTSSSFFATWAGGPRGMPAPKPARGHRHISASINYHASGHGTSVVDGSTVAWKAGDLLFSAPSWSEHIHYPGADGFRILTIQDHPMHIALGSLLWQEQMDGHIYSLGSEPGQTGYTGPRERGA